MTDDDQELIKEQRRTIALLDQKIDLLEGKIDRLETKNRALEMGEERVKLLQDENDRMRGCLKYLDKHGGLGLDIHERITKALTRYS